jgi:hypothetical protein
MTTVLLWMLLSADHYGKVTTVAYFADQKQCEHVRRHVVKMSIGARCVQANVMLPGVK